MVVRFLRDEGVKYIYGYPGGALLHIYDALFKEKALEHILVRHEQAATHMADGYARATGKAGVVLVTSGPGATNAITGIATAYMDSIPMVVISGQVPSTMVGTDAFQETDMIGISRPIVKHSYIFNVNSAGTDPGETNTSLTGMTGIEIALSTNATATQVATALVTAVGDSGFTGSSSAAVATITKSTAGLTTRGNAGNCGFTYV